MFYTPLSSSTKSRARLGTVHTDHGDIPTPFFMPIATKGAIKNISMEEMHALGADVLLSNTYHLFLQPGEALVKEAGGLHSFMNWDKPILTDSGGYQVFSLGGNKGKGDNLVKLTEEGVHFRSHLDGARKFISPEKAICIQTDLGVDMAMCLDHCPEGNAPKEDVEAAVELTHHWAKRCVEEKKRLQDSGSVVPRLFGIVQGSIFEDLRKRSLDQLVSLPFDGLAIGGLAVGENRDDMFRILRYLTPLMPADKPRYLMGLGRPEEIVEAVKNGVDMFDCVIPTREARHGRLYTFTDNDSLDGDFYTTHSLTKSEYSHDFSPINPSSRVPLLREHTKAYLHHLFKTGEGLGYRLATLHNLEFYLELMRRIREDIRGGMI